MKNKILSYITLPVVATCYLVYLIFATILRKNYYTDIGDIGDNLRIFCESWVDVENYDNM